MNDFGTAVQCLNFIKVQIFLMLIFSSVVPLKEVFIYIQTSKQHCERKDNETDCLQRESDGA